MEVELKFALSAEAAKRLRASEFSDAEVKTVRSLYYDTEQNDLRAAGFSLRVREMDGARLQTLKGDGAVERFEREAPLDREEPDLDALAGSPAADVLRGARVHPVFETRVRRAVSTLANGEGTIELALDDGELIAGARAEPIRELELELKAGPARRLFEEAELWRARHGLSLCLSSKAERGYALVAGETSRAPKLRQPKLTRDDPAREVFRGLAVSALAAFDANVRHVRVGDSLEAVHQARVSLRRLRAIIGAFRPVVDDERRPAIEQALRDFANRFGEARDLDVFVSEAFRPLIRHEPGVAAFGRRLLIAQGEARERVRRALAEGEADAFLLSTLEWMMAGDWAEAPTTREAGERPLADLAPRMLNKVWKTFRTRGKGLDWSDPHARHRLRIQAKKLRYLGDALEAAAPRPKGFDKTLRKFQDAAGRLNDIHMAADIARRALGDGASEDAVFAAGEVVGAARAGGAALIRTARTQYVALLERGAYW